MTDAPMPGLRDDADAPMTTRVTTSTVERLPKRCAHGRDAWVIDGEQWHERRGKSVSGARCTFLEPCEKGKA